MNASTTAVCLAGTALLSVAYAVRTAFEHDTLVDSDHAEAVAPRTGREPVTRRGQARLVPAPVVRDRVPEVSRLVAAV